MNYKRPTYMALIVLCGIALSETLIVSGYGLYGLIGYAIVLQLALYSSAIRWKFPAHRSLVMITTVPVLRLAGFSFSLLQFPPTVWYILVWTVMTLAVLTAARVLGWSYADIRLAVRSFPPQFIIALTGIVLGALFVFSGVNIATTALVDQGQVWLIFPAVMLIVGVTEELMFRGLLLKGMDAALGDQEMSGLYVAVLYTVLHIGHGNWLAIALVFAVSLLFNWIARQTGSILGIGLAHGIINVMIAYSTLILTLTPIEQVSTWLARF